MRDPRLVGLADALDPEAIAPVLAAMVERAGARERLRVVALEPIRHRPGRRASIAYTLAGDTEEWRLFAKLFHDDAGAAVHSTVSRAAMLLAGTPLRVPACFGYDARRRMLVLEHVDAVPLASALYVGRSGVAARAARGIAALHRAGLPLARRWTAAREVHEVASWTLRRAPGDPVRRRVEAVLPSLRARAGELDAAGQCERPIHGEFRIEEVFEIEGEVGFLELERVTAGDPARDAGTFLAHLERHAAQQPAARSACQRARIEFLGAYGNEVGGDPAIAAGLERRIAFYETTTALRLALTYGARDRWIDSIPGRLLDFGEARLANDGRKS